MSNKIFEWGNLLIRIAFVLLGFVFFHCSSWQLPEEEDTYFIMNLGRYILEHGFPHIDPFTIHENLHLVVQQWLSGIIFWEAYKNFGVDGVLTISFLVGVSLVLIYWRLCLFVSDGNKTLSLVMGFFVGILIVPLIIPRPWIFSALILLVEVFLLEKFTRTEDKKFLIPLPVLSVALINLQSAMWLMMLVVCLPFLFVKNIRHIKFLLAAMAGIFLCGFINPYGFEAMTYVFNSYGVDIINDNIIEMLAPTAHDLSGKIFYFVAAFTIFTLGKFKVPWRYVFLSGGIIFMAVMHWRNILLFYLLATITIAYAWKNFSPEKIFPKTDEQYKNRDLMIMIFFMLAFLNTVVIENVLKNYLQKLSAPLEILFFAAVLFMLYTLLVLKTEGRILHPAILPRKNLSLLISLFIGCGILFVTVPDAKKHPPQPFTDAIEFLLKNERPENISLYLNQNMSGLAGMQGIKYYIDARQELFLPVNNPQGKNILGEYIALVSGSLYYKVFFDNYNFTHIILASNKEALLFNALSDDPNYKVIYERTYNVEDKIITCKIFVLKTKD